MMIFTLLFMHILVEANFIAPPQNMTVNRGSNVTISCGYVITIARPVTWIINGTSFNQEQIFFNSLYRLNRQATPAETSLTVFSIKGTTTFQCVVHSTPVTTSTLGTINVIGMYVCITVVLAMPFTFSFSLLHSQDIDFLLGLVKMSIYICVILVFSFT